jgi:hypothetical protein
MPLQWCFDGPISTDGCKSEPHVQLRTIYRLFKCSDDKSPLYELVKRFSGTGLSKDSIQSAEEQVDMFLHAASHDERFRVIHNTFTRSIETISPISNKSCLQLESWDERWSRHQQVKHQESLKSHIYLLDFKVNNNASNIVFSFHETIILVTNMIVCSCHHKIALVKWLMKCWTHSLHHTWEEYTALARICLPLEQG